MISSDEAFLLFDKWQREHSVLLVRRGAAQGRIWFWASIASVSSRLDNVSIEATLFDGRQGRSDLDLREATFEYADPREAEDPVLSAVAFACFLLIRLPDGGSVWFMECK